MGSLAGRGIRERLKATFLKVDNGGPFVYGRETPYGYFGVSKFWSIVPVQSLRSVQHGGDTALQKTVAREMIRSKYTKFALIGAILVLIELQFSSRATRR